MHEQAQVRVMCILQLNVAIFKKNQYSGTFIKTLKKKIRVDSLQRAREGGGLREKAFIRQSIMALTLILLYDQPV